MSIPVLSPEEFRQKLAGYADPTRTIPPEDLAQILQAAVRFVSILASLFGGDLDRLKIWDRIGTGLVVAVTKAGGDFDTFVNCCLAHIKSDPGKVASSAPLAELLAQLESQPAEWRTQFLRLVESRHYLILVKARARWISYRDKVLEAL